MRGFGPKRLIVTDVDSTFIRQEQIELLAEFAGTREQVAEITERAMRGELDFAESLRERVATLAGVPVGALDEVRRAVVLSEGAAELVAECHRRGWAFGLVSGGFEEIVGSLAAEHGVTLLRANRLGVDADLLTGRTVGEVIDRPAKERILRQWAAACGVPMELTVAVGDGANDLDMIGAAGIGIAYQAKPIVRAQASHTIEGSLLEVLTKIPTTA
ncbi:MAG: phosphoserine phosphatase SerB [Promicromonosporaceae bacterium]|nr:phosphoserine phosphatase SerB [Promicromonosporaceae bacterium]